MMNKKRSKTHISKDKFLFYIFILYVTTTIFTPKIDFGFITIYLFEPFLILIAFYLILKRKIVFLTNIEKAYLLFMAISILTYPIGVFNTDIIDIKTIILVIKYVSFGFIIPISYYYSKYINEKNISLIIFVQSLFVIIFGSYVLFNMILFPIPMVDIIWGYSQEYRLIGFTGYGIGVNGLRMIGTTSVQTGVFVSLIFLIYLSLYVNLSKRKYLYIMIVLFIGEMLTQSRSGLLILFIGILYIILDKYNNKNILKILFTSIVGLTSIIWYFDLLEFISTFGTIGKIVSTIDFKDGSSEQRLMYMGYAIEYISENPLAIFIGTGYGEGFSQELIGVPFLENLIFTVFFQSGIIGFSVVVSIFYFMWHYAKKYTNKRKYNIYSAILYGVKLFIPGFFLANAVGGNSLQTDFIVPFLFYVIGTTVYKLKKEQA
jgi:hypothetical protein